MGRELGRISGPLLADNLKRNGADLAVETQLLYLDVANKYIGVNTNIPTREFLVNGLTNTTNQIVDTQADLGYFTINTSTIQNVSDAIYLIPNQVNTPTVVVPKLQAGQLVLSTNTVSNTTTNGDINFSPNGTGQLVSNKSVLINGDLHATGNVTFDGNVTIGDGNTDSVTFGADVVSNIIPDVTNTYDLGSKPQSTITGGSASFVAVSTQYLIVGPNSAFTLGTNDFTIEFWFNQTTRSAFNGVFSYGRAAAYNVAGNMLLSMGTSQFAFSIGDGTTAAVNLTLSPLPSTNAWHHMAVVRNGTTFTVYVDGAVVGSTTGVTYSIPAQPGDLTIGHLGTGGGFMYDGQITNFRVVNGTAVYTNTFTPPTAPLSAITNTVLLLKATNSAGLLTDSSVYNWTVTTNNTPTYSSATPFTSVIAGRDLTWKTLYAGTATLTTGSIGEFTVTNNIISISTTNQSAILLANGTGIISIPSNNISLGQNLAVTGTASVTGTTTLSTTGIIGTVNISGISLDGGLLSFDSGSYTLDSVVVGAYNQTGSSYITGTFANNTITITGAGSYITAPNIKIQNNVISNTTAGNADITLSSTGTGSVVLENLSIKNSRITNTAASPTTDLDKSIVVSPSKNLVINSTRFLKIPYSNNSDQVLTSVGNIRLNRTTSLYEGYQSYGFDSFNNVYDVSRTTSITAELTPGNNDKTIRFNTNGIVNTTMTSAGITASRVDAGNVSFTSNIISNKINTNDVNLTATGTGKVNLNNIQIYASTGTTSIVKNTTTNAITSFVNQGTGFVKFAGTTAVTLPVGTTAGVGGRPTVFEIGMTRFNTTIDKVEIYSGNPAAGDNGWIPVAGVAGAQLSQAEVTDILNIMAIVMG